MHVHCLHRPRWSSLLWWRVFRCCGGGVVSCALLLVSAVFLVFLCVADTCSFHRQSRRMRMATNLGCLAQTPLPLPGGDQRFCVPMELATQAAPGINTYATNLRANFESTRVLWRKDSISMSSMVGSLLSRSPMSMIYSTGKTCVAIPPSRCWMPL